MWQILIRKYIINLKKLKELKESEKDKKKPILDHQEKAAINFKLQEGLQNNLFVKIK
mgnify:CR=1 FL=1